MEPEDIIALLEPLREPAPISWWPPAPGWWLLALVVAVALSSGLRFVLARRRRRAPLRAAQREFQALRSDPGAPHAGASRLAVLLRQIALAKTDDAAERARASRLSGDAWARYLNALVDSDHISPAHTELAYRPEVSATELNDALDASDGWLKALGARW